jgi:hypothetical protein
MIDRTVKQAATAGIRTQPVPSARRNAKYIRGDIRLAHEEVAIAVEMARNERIEQQIRDYAWKKRNQ